MFQEMMPPLRYYCRLGIGYVAFGPNPNANPNAAARIDHFCATVEDYRLDDMRAEVKTHGLNLVGAPGFNALPDPGPFGNPPSYYYPYGGLNGTQPLYGVQGGVGFTYNSLNYAPFSTVSSSNTSTIPNQFGGFLTGQTSLTILPLSAAGRISVVPTGVGSSFNQVIIR